MFVRDALMHWKSAAAKVDIALATRIGDARERAVRADALTRITLRDRLVDLWEQVRASTVVLVTNAG